ncbi:MAG: hypothetical protein CMJ78_06930 [Planctomycetaceae bacterium]|nr:hypothetical protein [Planctomycetaceae bacterium]
MIDESQSVLFQSDTNSESVQEVRWQPLRLVDDIASSSGERTRGFLYLGPKELLGVGIACANGRTAIIHSTADFVKPDTSVVLRALPLAGGITFAWLVGLHGIAVYLILSRMKDQSKSKSADPHESSLRHIQALVRTRDTIILGLAKLAESRDPVTGQHLERIALFSTRLATALRREKEYRNVMTRSFIQLMGISSALHDIDKVGIKDSILLKPGPLTESERKQIEQHPVIGSDCLRQMEQRLGTSNFLQMANEITLYHHERWDGAGYPHGLSGEDIPLTARIVAIADVYDALASERVYKSAVPHQECVEFIKDQAGKQFDPKLVKIFLSIESQFDEISQKYRERTPVRFAVEAIKLGFPGFSQSAATPQAPKQLDEVLSSVETSEPLELISQE